MAELGIQHVYQGQSDKRAAIISLLKRLNVSKSGAAYVGDDLADIPAMKQCGLAIAVANAHELVKRQADLATEKRGGAGAVREVCELILRAQGKLDELFNEYLR
jgi:3-deoxy-D-manno-octulosonate 8-phosphate phosphatase (KDO 8-P phosphatase)